MFENKKLIKTLKEVINSLEEEKTTMESQIKNRDKLIKDYQEEHEILLENSAELRAKIVDLEANIEFLTNNLTPAKRKKLGL